jgi:hypothetical protein
MIVDLVDTAISRPNVRGVIYGAEVCLKSSYASTRINRDPSNILQHCSFLVCQFTVHCWNYGPGSVRIYIQRTRLAQRPARA